MTPTDADPEDLLPLSPEEEATMQAEIELALEPLRATAPANLLPILRENLEYALRTHPYPRQLLRAFAPRKDAIQSGEGRIDGVQQSHEQVGGRGRA